MRVALGTILCCASFILCGSVRGDTNLTLIWADEFALPEGSSPDASKWSFDIGGNGWGNAEWQTYTSRTNNARIEGGQLVIEAKQEAFTGPDNIQRNYTSARLLTKGKWSWTYGRMEARIKIPFGQGIWPAFWMLGANIDSVGWPACGEIDILENIGREPAIVHGTIHGPGYSGAGGIGGAYSLPGNVPFADDFHIYAVEWSTNQIKWFVDGQQYLSLTPANLPNGATWVYTQPQFILLNVAVGGQWPGYPDQTTIFPQRMTVDYVRVYSITNVSPASPNATVCGGNVLANPGFENGGLLNWTTYGNTIGNTQVGSSNNLPVRSGSNVFKVYGQFAGGENYSGVYQDTASAPGKIYTGNAWAYTPGGDKIAIGNTAWVEVSFRDAAANILSLYRTALITNSTPANDWVALAVTNQINPTTFAVMGSTNKLAAPAGTSFVRYQVVFRQPALGNGAVLFDDLTLALPIVTNIPLVASLDLKNGSFNYSFPTIAGLAYRVQYKNSLSAAEWQVATNFVASGNSKSVSNAMSVQQRYYRVVCECN